jgi:hypothetical protein
MRLRSPDERHLEKEEWMRHVGSIRLSLTLGVGESRVGIMEWHLEVNCKQRLEQQTQLCRHMISWYRKEISRNKQENGRNKRDIAVK